MSTRQRKSSPSPCAGRQRARLSHFLPLIRGLLAEPTGNEDIPYKPVILKSLMGKEAVDFASNAKNAEAEAYPAPLTKGKSPPLFLGAVDYNAAAEDLRKKLSKTIRDYSQQYKRKPSIICLPCQGILYVDNRKEDPHLPLQGKVALVTGAAGAIGYGVCRGLLEKGCCLAATDLPGKKLDTFVTDLKENVAEHIIGIPIDVSD